MGLGEDSDPGQSLFNRTSERIKAANVFNFLIEEFDADRQLIGFGREDIDDATAHPVGAALKINVVARVLEFGELPQNAPLIDDLTPRKVHDHFEISFGVP